MTVIIVGFSTDEDVVTRIASRCAGKIETIDASAAAEYIASVVTEQEIIAIPSAYGSRGFHLGEAMILSWDDEGKIEVDFSGRRPMLRIPARHQKAKRDTLLPMSPEFAEFLAETPREQRTVPVFPLPVVGLNTISKVISAIGEAAGVVVDKEGQEFASAHDIRRAFGFRWSSRVMPAVLKELMRHTDIGTTMRYYVTQNAEQTADVIWEAVGKGGRKVGTSVGSNEKSPAEHIEGA